MRHIISRKVQYPEKGVWNDDVSESLLNAILVYPLDVAKAMAEINAELHFKKKFKLLSDALSHGGTHPSSFHAMFVTHFIKTRGTEYEAVSTLLDQVVAAAEGNHA